MGVKRLLQRSLNHVPVLGSWLRTVDAQRQRHGSFGPGHFYSPIPSANEIEAAIAAASHGEEAGADGIDLREEHQYRLLRTLANYYETMPFPEQQRADCRYWLDNGFFSYADGILLHCLMRHLRPRRIVEVGSGFSSAAMLDTDERCLGAQTQFTFIEPYPDRLRSLLRRGDERRATVLKVPVQQAPLELFTELAAGDILFIDSSHVGKANSDVLHLLFKVLPRLRRGVFVHVHDIFPHFEYPAAWLREGRYWNEAYLVRAFLQWNARFRISLWVPWLMPRDAEFVRDAMPLCGKNTGGSLWLEVTGG